MTINITKWVTKKKVVENAYQIPEIIGMEARKSCGRGWSIGDPVCGVHRSIGTDHP